jgi:hypothetical protein
MPFVKVIEGVFSTGQKQQLFRRGYPMTISARSLMSVSVTTSRVVIAALRASPVDVVWATRNSSDGSQGAPGQDWRPAGNALVIAAADRREVRND